MARPSHLPPPFSPVQLSVLLFLTGSKLSVLHRFQDDSTPVLPLCYHIMYDSAAISSRAHGVHKTGDWTAGGWR